MTSLIEEIPQKVQLANLIEGLSLAVDLAEGKPLLHALNVTILALRVAEKIGFSSEDKDTLYFAGLLHDITITSKDDLCPVCEAVKEYNLSPLVPSLMQADTVIHSSRESWDGSGPNGFQGERIPIASRILSIIMSMDEHVGETQNCWLWQERVSAMLKAGSGRQFDPVLVNLVEELLKDQRFYLDLFESEHNERISPFRPQGSILISGDLFSVLGKAFAIFIDNKSRYTANHSQDVAHCAGNIATHLGLSEQSVRTIYLAGLLHDLGKVAIPNEILEKPGKLTESEYDLIKSHPYYTAFILDKIPELRTVGFLASAHHERLDGSGYYLGRKGENLPLEARLIAVADVYAALAADRPYRKGMDPKEITKIMKKMAQIRHLDADLVSIAIKSFE